MINQKEIDDLRKMNTLGGIALKGDIIEDLLQMAEAYLEAQHLLVLQNKEIEEWRRLSSKYAPEDSEWSKRGSNYVNILNGNIAKNRYGELLYCQIKYSCLLGKTLMESAAFVPKGMFVQATRDNDKGLEITTNENPDRIQIHLFDDRIVKVVGIG